MAAQPDHFAIANGAGFPPVTAFQEMYAMGARWVRLDVPWVDIERTAGVFSWTATDTAVNAAKAAGLKLILILWDTPAFYRVGGSTASYHSPPVDVSKFRAFCQLAAGRYKADAYEIWNEGNLSAFWGSAPNPEKYATVLAAGYDGVKAAQPGAIVITGGMAPAGPLGESTASQMNGLTFLQRVFAAGGGAKCDAIGWHPYDRGGFGYHPSSAWSQMVETPTSVRTILEQTGQGQKPIWATEYGNSRDWGLTDAVIASRVTDAYSRWGGFPWPKGPLCYFTYRSTVTDGNGFSLVDPVTNVPRPAYSAYRDAPRATTPPPSDPPPPTPAFDWTVFDTAAAKFKASSSNIYIAVQELKKAIQAG